MKYLNINAYIVNNFYTNDDFLNVKFFINFNIKHVSFLNLYIKVI